MRGCCLPRRSLGDNRTKAGRGGRRGGREPSMRDDTVFCVRILDATQIRRLIAFSSAVDVTIQRFNESRQEARVSKVRTDPFPAFLLTRAVCLHESVHTLLPVPLVPRSVDHRDHENRLPTHSINDAVWEAARVNPSNAAKLIAKSRQ